MRKSLFLFFILLANFLFANFAFSQKDKDLQLKTANDSLSYALGLSVAENLKRQEIEDLNPEAVGSAFRDYYKNEKKMTQDAANQLIQRFFEKKEAAKHQDAVKESEKFLAENAQKKGVKVLKSGLQYKILKEGTGASPKLTDKVRVHYEGKLINGKKFDSSYDRGQPAEFGVTNVIKGWTEILQLMKEGGVREVYIPYDLAYGSRQMGRDIPPFSTLIFKIELLKIL